MAGFFAGNIDYLLFVSGTLVAFALLCVALPLLRGSPRLPRATWFIVGALLVAGWFPVRQAGQRAKQSMQEMVEGFPPTYAQEVERMGHARITPQTDPNDPTYLAIIQAEIRWEAVNTSIADIYTMRKMPDGRNIFIVDSETDYDRNGKYEGAREQRTAIGEVYEKQLPALEQAFAGKAAFVNEPYTDRWGTWVSAFVPLRDADGKSDGVLGVDFDGHLWLAGIAKARRERIAQEALVLGIVAAAMIFIGILQTDIARRRAVEEQLRKSQERWALNAQQMPLASIEWNPDGEILAWNPSAERIFGYSSGEVLQRKGFSMLLTSGERANAQFLWDELLAKKEDSRSVDQNLTKDGRVITCEWVHTRVKGRDGEVVAVMSLAQDITERLNLQAQLLQAHKMQSIGLLAAGIAHDFNNSLTVIDGFTNLLLARNDLPADAADDLGFISSAADRAAHLTRQLLTFSRQQAMHSRTINLNEAVTGTATMLERVLGANISLQCDLATRLPAIEADPSMLEQVITNLALNARDAMPDGGRIVLKTEAVEFSGDQMQQHPQARTGRAVLMSVTDTGCGISPDQLGRIFEPFYTTKEVGKGTGLGLAAVHGIVSQHRGWIEVESNVGRGTTVRIFLPPSSQNSETAELERRQVPGHTVSGLSADKTVLLVEDDPLVRKLARTTLLRAGFQVLEAEDGRRAEEIWKTRQNEIGLLVTDMVMPNGVTGHELARQCLAQKPELAVVYASGYSVETAAPGFCESAGQLFLAKPYLPQELISTVYRSISSTKAVVPNRFSA